MPTNSHKQSARVMLWAGRLIGVLLLVYFMAIAIQNMTQCFISRDFPILLFLLAFFTLAGIVLSWWEKWIALLFLGADAFIVIATSGHFDSFIMLFSGSCLASGGLFFGSWLLMRGDEREHEPPSP